MSYWKSIPWFIVVTKRKPGSQCFYVRTILLVILLATVSIIVSQLDNHDKNNCMTLDPIGLYLDEWLLGRAVAQCIFLLFSGLLVRFVSQPNLDWMACLLWHIDRAFCLGWFIIGIIILARSSSSCLSDPVGVMTMIELMYCW